MACFPRVRTDRGRMNDKILRFPGARRAAAPPPAPVPPDLAHLSDDQRKAVQIVLSGMPFVAVGIQPTERGADFFTAVHGEPTDLRNAQPHLHGVIERAFARKGL